MDELLTQVRWQDVADVLVLTFVLYRLYLWLRGTVAVQVLAGMLVLAAAAFAANQVGLLLTAYLLQALGAVATLLVVVIFRDEIRGALGRVNPFTWWRTRRGAAGAHASPTMAHIIGDAVFALAHRRVGALIVLPGTDATDEHLTGGVMIDAVPSLQLFEAIFHTSSPMHDGATLVAGGRVRLAGCFLPVSTSAALPDNLGSRHRAAVGLTEACDAAVLVVSEERGAVSLVYRSAIQELASTTALVTALTQVGHAPGMPAPVRRRPQRVRDVAALVVIAALVSTAWWIVVGEGGTVVTHTVSIDLRNLPDDIEADAPHPARAIVHVRGPRTRLEALSETDVQAWVDCEGAGPGRNRLPLEASAPRGIEITEIVPSTTVVRLRPRE